MVPYSSCLPLTPSLTTSASLQVRIDSLSSFSKTAIPHQLRHRHFAIFRKLSVIFPCSSSMLSVDATQVNEVLDHRSLIEHLRSAFRSSSIATPLRHHHSLPVPPQQESTGGSSDSESVLQDLNSGPASTTTGQGQDSRSPTLLLMPAWHTAAEPGKALYAGVKYVSVFPNNIVHRLPTISGLYILSSAETGIPLAVIDGTAITAWRTACASALAADYLARRDAKVLVMVGAGAMAPHLVAAHVTVRPSISEVLIWNRSPARALALASHLHQCISGVHVEATEDLESAVRKADVVSCATLASQPVLRGAWLRSGTHVDLVGAFTATTRESDDDVMARARGTIYVDTLVGVLEEGGDIAIPLQRGFISKADIAGELSELTGGTVSGRTNDKDITVFKSVGTALEDLAAAQLVYEKLLE